MKWALKVSWVCRNKDRGEAREGEEHECMGVYHREQGAAGLPEARHRREKVGNKAGRRLGSRSGKATDARSLINSAGTLACFEPGKAPGR